MDVKKEGREDPDGWVEAALQDDAMVATLLMRLSKPPVPPQWGFRQPRTKQISKIIFRVKETEESARASPTTPFSLSTASSSSGGGGDCAAHDDSIRSATGKRRADDEPGVEDTKSKIGGSKTSLKLGIRTKKKKTFAELKGEESLLLIERVNLNKELESRKAACQDLWQKNEKLKKLMMDLESRSAVKTSSIAPNPLPAVAFELPDLNLLPTEEESGSDMLYELS